MYALGSGTIYIAYVEMKEFSRDAVEDEPHHPDPKQTEAYLKIKEEHDHGLEPTATTTPANIAWIWIAFNSSKKVLIFSGYFISW